VQDREPIIRVIAEGGSGRLEPITAELVAFASQMRTATGAKVAVVVLGDPVAPLAAAHADQFGCEVLGIEAPGASRYLAETWVALLENLHRLHPAQWILVPHTSSGWEFAPALAVRLGASCLSSVSGFREEDGKLVFSRQVCGGKLLEELQPLRGRPAVLTVMPGTAAPQPETTGTPGPVRILKVTPPPPRVNLLDRSAPSPDSPKLRQAEAIVAAGRGIGSVEYLERVRLLASLFKGGAVGASRPLCDLGWLPLEHQVGMTGQTVSPRLYLACGISGMVQHTMGIRNAALVVSINRDPHAPFSRIAHYRVVADLREFLPLLIDRIRKNPGRADGRVQP